MLRRGVVGRLLIAMRDSPAACGTLGLDMRWFRVGLFALSAGMAGLAGALFAGLRADHRRRRTSIYFKSLLLLLFAVVLGVTSVTGAVLGGVALMVLPVLQIDYPSVAGMFFVVIAVGAVLLGRRTPTALANHLFRLGRWLERRIAPRIRANLPTLPGPVVEPTSSDAPASDRDARWSAESEGVPAHAH